MNPCGILLGERGGVSKCHTRSEPGLASYRYLRRIRIWTRFATLLFTMSLSNAFLPRASTKYDGIVGMSLAIRLCLAAALPCHRSRNFGRLVFTLQCVFDRNVVYI